MKKILFSLLLVLSFQNAHAEIPGVARTIIQFRHAPFLTLLELLDPGHQRMLQIGNPTPIYTQKDADNLDATAFAYILKYTGLDFSNVVPDANGIRFLPTALCGPISFTADNSYNVLFDSSMNNQGGTWTVKNNTLIVVFEATGQFPAGTLLAGQSFNPNDTFGYGITDHLRVGEPWTDPQNRHHFIVSGVRPGQQPTNSFGILENHAPLQYLDTSSGKIGFGTDNVYTVPDPTSPTNATSVNHHVITFFTTHESSPTE